MVLLFLKAQVLVHIINKKPSIKQGFLIFGCFIFSFIWVMLLYKIKYHCPFLHFFHIYCAGCGGTRMILSILRLDFYQAFRYNPLLFILFILGIIYFIIMIFIYIKKKIIVVPSFYSLLILLFILLVYMVLRNIPEFSFLIPTKV